MPALGQICSLVFLVPSREDAISEVEPLAL